MTSLLIMRKEARRHPKHDKKPQLRQEENTGETQILPFGEIDEQPCVVPSSLIHAIHSKLRAPHRASGGFTFRAFPFHFGFHSMVEVICNEKRASVLLFRRIPSSLERDYGANQRQLRGIRCLNLSNFAQCVACETAGTTRGLRFFQH